MKGRLQCEKIMAGLNTTMPDDELGLVCDVPALVCSMGSYVDRQGSSSAGGRAGLRGRAQQEPVEVYKKIIDLNFGAEGRWC